MSLWLQASRPLIIGHRGASAYAPENSLSAFSLAAEQGADGVELDIRLSADGCPVVMHDATVERTTNGRGAVADLTVDELRRLDIGDGQPVPTLDEVLERFGGSLLLNLELKGLGLLGGRLAAAVAERVQDHGLAERVLVSSFNPWLLRRGRGDFSERTALALLKYGPLAGLGELVFSGPAVHPDYRLVDAAAMARARRRGQRVHVWTVDDPAEARRLVALGVHGLITNDPAGIIAALAAGYRGTGN